MKRPAVEAVPVAAYDRFADLIAPAGQLRLPERFVLLQRIHNAIDCLVQLAADRDQPAIFHRLKRPAENIIGRYAPRPCSPVLTRRDVTLAHVQQLAGLLPGIWTFRAVHVQHDGRRTASVALGFERRLQAADLVARRESVHKALLGAVHTAHRQFMADVLGAQVPAAARLRSWHPKFDLDAVPDPAPAELLPAPAAAVAVPAQIRGAIADTAALPAAAAAAPAAPAAKPQSLLDRIRQKEKVSQALDILADATHRAQHSELATLQEFAESLAFLFGTAGKSALLLGEITSKLVLGAKSAVAPEDIAARVRRLSALVPEWAQLVATAGVQMVRIDRRLPLKTVQVRLAAALL